MKTNILFFVCSCFSEFPSSHPSDSQLEGHCGSFPEAVRVLLEGQFREAFLKEQVVFWRR